MEQSLQLEKRSKELLDLPVELIQHFLLNATTPTFLQAIYSCRTLYDIALQCREVLIHHLERVPGFIMWGVGLDDPDPEKDREELFLLLRRRACEHLYGANFCAEKTTFNFPAAECGGLGDIKVPACSLARFRTINTVLVRRGDSIHSDRVYLYDVGASEAILRGILLSPYDHPGKVEVLKTTYSHPSMLSVLQRYTPESPVPDNPHEPAYTKQFMVPFRQEGIHLVHYKLEALEEQEPTVCAFPDHPDYVPLTMAVADETTFAISWEHSSDSNLHEVVLYVISVEEMMDESNVVSGHRYVCCSGVIVVNSGGSVPDAIMTDHIGYQPANVKPTMETSAVTHIDFGDQNNQLLYSYGAFPMYKSYQNLDYNEVENLQATVLFPNSCTVRFTEQITLRFAIDLPFFGTHELPGDASNLCTWKYLSIGIATHRKEGWTVACLLKSQTSCRSNRCGHVMNLKRGRRFAMWRAVARLWGYRKPSNSIGGIIATSTSGARIAIANWDVIYVWALNPLQIIEENSGGYYRTPSTFHRSPSSSVSSTPSPAPNAEGTETAAQNKSAALNHADEGMIELKPIVLPLGAVCFKLEFVEGKDDELVALTDKGLMSWSLGPSGKGRRDLREALPVVDKDEDEDEGGDEDEEEMEGQPARKKVHVAI